MNQELIVQKTRFPSPHPHIDLYIVTYLSTGLKVKGMLAEPRGTEELDGFLYLRGGIGQVGRVRPSRLIEFASQGFIVFAPFYRGNQGSEGRDEFGGMDRYDAYNGYELLKNHPRVNQIHLFGFSRGGLMALWTAIQYKEASSCVVWNGVVDVEKTYHERDDLKRMLKRVIGGTPTKYPERYEIRNPLTKINELQVPVLIIHGKKDQNVLFSHATMLKEALETNQKKVKTIFLENSNHFFEPRINRQIVEVLSEWMKVQKR